MQSRRYGIEYLLCVKFLQYTIYNSILFILTLIHSIIEAFTEVSSIIKYFTLN